MFFFFEVINGSEVFGNFFIHWRGDDLRVPVLAG